MQWIPLAADIAPKFYHDLKSSHVLFCLAPDFLSYDLLCATSSMPQPSEPSEVFHIPCSSTIYSLSINFTAPTIFNIGCDLRANQNAAQLNDLRHVLSLQI